MKEIFNVFFYFVALLLSGCAHNTLREPNSFDQASADQSAFLIYSGQTDEHPVNPILVIDGTSVRLNLSIQNSDAKLISFIESSFDGTSFLPAQPSLQIQATTHPTDFLQKAFRFTRADSGIDLYYISSEGMNAASISRSFLDDKGQMGVPQKLFHIQDGSLFDPHALRMPDGRILLIFSKQTELQITYDVWGLLLDADITTQSKHPEACLELVPKSGYMGAYQCQIRRTPEFKGSTEESLFNQYTATILSFIGKDKKAGIIFDQNRTAHVSAPIDLEAYHAESAMPTLVKLVQYRQIVLINEAYHVPQTRFLTLQMLKPLYQAGFRYLAAETFYESKLAEVNRTGIPTLQTGFYTAEPSFAILVREAKKLGFKLVAYEGDAKKLQERIFARDPQAKVIVQVGYNQIDKVNDSDSNFEPTLAKKLWDLTKIEPFSIDQVSYRERGRPAAEDSNYRLIVDKFKITEPSVLVKEESGVFVSPRDLGHYDAQVILPPLEFAGGRPVWRAEIDALRLYRISDFVCPYDQLCLLQVSFRSESAHTQVVPFDQVLFDSVNPASLILATGRYDLKLIGPDLKVLKKKIITVEN